MKTKTTIKNLIEDFQSRCPDSIEIDEKAVIASYSKAYTSGSLAIKIISVIGGILAGLAFLGFLFVTGVYDSNFGTITVGVISILIALYVTSRYHEIFWDTLCISSYIIGLFLIGIGLQKWDITENGVYIILFTLSLIVLRLVQNYMLSFINTIIINFCIFQLIQYNSTFNLGLLHIVILAGLLLWLFLKEGRIVSKYKAFAPLYQPVKIGLLLFFLCIVFVLTKRTFILSFYDFYWVTSLAFIGLNILVLSKIFTAFSITETSKKYLLYGATILGLLPTLWCPTISATLLILLLSYFVNYKTGIVLGIVSFIYAIGLYYYDLNMTLLTKSVLLFCSGILFLIIYWLNHKNLNNDEKI